MSLAWSPVSQAAPTYRLRLIRWVLALVAGCLGALGLVAAQPTPAFAASDEIDVFSVAYDLQPSGVLRVSETIIYRFGDQSGRHGIERFLVTRERYDDRSDAVYGISNIRVSSPDGVPTQFRQTRSETNQGRGEQLRLRIGDPDRTIAAATATYVLSYEVTGAMRNSPTYDELSWDATGFDWAAPIRQVDVSATVPGGALDVTCFFGAVGSTTTCDEASAGPVAQFSQAGLGVGQGMSIGVKVTPGLISDNGPRLEPDGSALSGAQRAALTAGGVGFGLAAVGSPIAGVLWWRRNGRDQRYAGLAPGTTPRPGDASTVVAHDPDLPIPVVFSPPRIPVAEAGLLIDGQVDARETAATIIDLAVRGALTVQSTGDDDFQVTLVDPGRAAAPHEVVLLSSLFSGGPPGTRVDLSTPGSMVSAHRAMQTSVRNQVAARGWFRKVPSTSTAAGLGFGAFAFVAFGLFTLGSGLILLLPLLPVLITLVIIRVKLRRGQRTADGRAVCDQVEGFKTYLATAEADQLRFEEGEDIFSRYLPWAIAFELADRWAEICGDLVAMGRLPDQVPYWYAGNYYSLTAFNTSFLTSGLTSAASPAPSSGAGGTGLGGGSSFGGGGFSGGGGGGGGGGSW